jgi:AAA domain
VLTSDRTVEIITGPAGTGKTRVLATAASIWDGPVFGTATSQNATNELRAAGVQVAANTTRLLTDLAEGHIPPGSLILADEGSMISAAHLAAVVAYAARNSCKLVLAGDQEQLAAVEGGGAMTLLADRLGYVQLAEPVRFTAAWERGASLRLRAGDATALDEYDQQGRIRGAPPEVAMDQAARAYVASYLADRDVLLMAADWARCRELSARIRGDLIHLGLVDGGRTIRIADGALASVGDLIICRRNDHAIEAGEPGRALANGDVLRIEAITPGGVMVRRRLDPDRATGQRRFTERAFRYPGYQSADLAYAITGHSAQGATVHTGIALVTGTEDRQWLYPAMTRGTHVNLAFAFTTPDRPADPQPGTRPAPTARSTDMTIPATRSAPNPATRHLISGPPGIRPSPSSGRPTGRTSAPCPTAACGCSATPTPPKPPGHPATSAANYGYPGAAPSTPASAPSAPPPKPTPPARPATTAAPHSRTPWPPPTRPWAASTGSASRPRPGHGRPARLGTGHRRLPAPGRRRRRRTTPQTPRPDDRDTALRRTSPRHRHRTRRHPHPNGRMDPRDTQPAPAPDARR